MQDELRKEAAAYLEKYHLKKSALSSYLGISPQYLSDWLYKRVDYDNEKVLMIRKFLNRKFY